MTSLARRILVADDDPNDVQLILRAFRKSGFGEVVDVVRDGQEALDFLRRTEAYSGRDHKQPAVVVLDIKMPRVGGLEALEQMRRDPALRELPVVILTSSKESRDLQRAYALGANAFVVKPTAFKAMIEAVERIAAFWGATNEPPAPP